ADLACRLSATALRGRSHVVEHNRSSTPKGDETQQRGRGHQNARNSIAPSARGSRVVGNAAHVRISLPSRMQCSHFSRVKSTETDPFKFRKYQTADDVRNAFAHPGHGQMLRR